MTDLERFNEEWTDYPPFNGQRGYNTKKEYESILFSIWKHHPDYDKDGFQIKSRDRKVYRVLKLALNSGLLIMAKNYSVGNHTRLYHKNNILFDLVFRSGDNPYKEWLDNRKSKDMVNKLLTEQLETKSKNLIILPLKVYDKNSKSRNRKVKRLCYDIEKLYDLSKTMLPYYYDLTLKMNAAAIHDDFKFLTFIYFDENGLPTGRPYSYFCSTLNDKKKHKIIDGSMEFRKDFLNRVGISDYREVYDIKSEFPRVNYLFHTGEWKDDSFDFYSEIIKDLNVKDILWSGDDYILVDGDTLSRSGSNTTDYNDSMKQLFMRIYFGKGTDRQSYNGYDKERLKRVKDVGIFKKMLDNGEGIDFSFWSVVCNSTRKVVGQPLGNLVMWFSFFIETEVKIELLNRGRVVYNVYDGFYFNGDIKDEIIDLLKVKSKFVYDNYMKVIRL